MKEYKKVINNRILALSFLILFCAGVILINRFFAEGTTMQEGIQVGFQGGLSAALILIGVITIFRYKRAIKNEEKLKKMYISENDERMKEIRRKAGLPITIIISCVMIAGSIVAGYYNTTVFYTLLGASVFVILCSGITKVYYMNKM